ncbi:MAG: hypothetical protein IAG13_35125 [Deltaproteobacteria bacterium]|nr:hypothetical protein [Nannocystaceae bacterium]
MTSVALVTVALLGCGDSDPSNNDESSSSGASTSTGGVDSSSTGDPPGTTAGSSSEVGTTVDGSESSTADSSSGETGEVVLHGACELADKVGSFALLREDIYTTFSGSVADGVVPVSVLENVGEDGDCRLLRRNNPFCDPACGPGQTCDFDGNCIAYPTNHDVGIVDVTGLLEPVSVEPIMPTYEYFDTQLPHPAWDEATVVQLGAAGGDYEPFELVGVGVAMIEPSGGDLVLDAEAPMTVEWVPGAAGLAKVRVELSIDQHGSTPSKLVCESDDTGMLTVSQELIAEFVALGVTGFPAANFYRETVDSVELAPGCVEFGVRSHVQTDLTVAGHTPCTGDDDCRDPQVCDIPNETCIDP